MHALLHFVESNASHECLYPMCAVAAFTGARRSEICRALVSDVDLPNSTITIRERKRSKSLRTTRTIPMCESLTTVLIEWLSIKPKSRHLLPEDHRSVTMQVDDSRKEAIKPFEASNFLNGVLADSASRSVRGYHTLRHSFISTCASKGVDQRYIDQWVGHQTDEQRRRYRHLFPSSQQHAIETVFA